MCTSPQGLRVCFTKSSAAWYGSQHVFDPWVIYNHKQHSKHLFTHLKVCVPKSIPFNTVPNLTNKYIQFSESKQKFFHACPDVQYKRVTDAGKHCDIPPEENKHAPNHTGKMWTLSKVQTQAKAPFTTTGHTKSLRIKQSNLSLTPFSR